MPPKPQRNLSVSSLFQRRQSSDKSPSPSVASLKSPSIFNSPQSPFRSLFSPKKPATDLNDKPSHISKLPPEVLRDILLDSYSPKDYERADPLYICECIYRERIASLAKIATVCTTWRDIAMPELYRFLVIPSLRCQGPKSGVCKKHRSCQLYRSLQDEKYAKLVKEMHLGIDLLDDFEYPPGRLKRLRIRSGRVLNRTLRVPARKALQIFSPTDEKAIEELQPPSVSACARVTKASIAPRGWIDYDEEREKERQGDEVPVDFAAYNQEVMKFLNPALIDLYIRQMDYFYLRNFAEAILAEPAPSYLRLERFCYGSAEQELYIDTAQKEQCYKVLNWLLASSVESIQELKTSSYDPSLLDGVIRSLSSTQLSHITRLHIQFYDYYMDAYDGSKLHSFIARLNEFKAIEDFRWDVSTCSWSDENDDWEEVSHVLEVLKKLKSPSLTNLKLSVYGISDVSRFAKSFPFDDMARDTCTPTVVTFINVDGHWNELANAVVQNAFSKHAKDWVFKSDFGTNPVWASEDSDEEEEEEQDDDDIVGL